MAGRSLLFTAILFIFSAKSYGVMLSSLPRTLIVTASSREVLKAGEGSIAATWSLNRTAAGAGASYKTVKAKLCYAPESQVDRAWRKTKDDLKKDKTCQFEIFVGLFGDSKGGSFVWKVWKDVPSAVYFVRVYAYDSDGVEVGYGQSTDKEKRPNVFRVEAISGRHGSIDIAAACFSAFSVFSLLGFFFVEKKKASLTKVG